MSYTEFELSAHDHAAEPPSSAYDLMIPTIDPQVPAIVRKVPDTMTKTLKKTIQYQCRDRCPSFLCQLSYNHMQPIGWNDIKVPRRAPMSEISPPKTGMALAIMYAMIVTPNVQPSHEIQWVGVFSTRCRLPVNMRTKRNLAGN